jgi:hypothetical protein
MATAQNLLKSIPQFARAYANGTITSREFVNTAFDHLANCEFVDTGAVPTIWEHVPCKVRDEFAAALRDALRPDFRWYPFLLSASEDEKRLEAEGNSARIAAWAIEFLQFFDDVTADAADDADR